MSDATADSEAADSEPDADPTDGRGADGIAATVGEILGRRLGGWLGATAASAALVPMLEGNDSRSDGEEREETDGAGSEGAGDGDDGSNGATEEDGSDEDGGGEDA
jgi:hypothetical protein